VAKKIPDTFLFSIDPGAPKELMSYEMTDMEEVRGVGPDI
jgi:hypothetical protein